MTAGTTTSETTEPSTSAATPRRVQLLNAAVQVVGESGLRGLTHRAVDRQAGVPEGTCSVSFRTRLALLTALTEHVGTELAEQVRLMGEALPDHDPNAPVDDADMMPAIDGTIELLGAWLTQPEMLICMTELSLEAVRTPSLRDSFDPWRDHLVDIVEVIVERGGKTQTRLRAQAIVASLEGVLVSALTHEPSRRKTYLDETLSLVIRGLVEVDNEGGC